MPGPDAPRARRRRSATSGPRTRQLVVRFSPDEWRDVAASAERDGLAVGAWVGDLARRVAAGRAEDVPVAWGELVGQIVRERAELVALVTALRGVSADADAAGPIDAAHALILRLDAAVDLVLSTERA